MSKATVTAKFPTAFSKKVGDETQIIVNLAPGVDQILATGTNPNQAWNNAAKNLDAIPVTTLTPPADPDIVPAPPTPAPEVIETGDLVYTTAPVSERQTVAINAAEANAKVKTLHGLSFAKQKPQQRPAPTRLGNVPAKVKQERRKKEKIRKESRRRNRLNKKAA